MENNNSSGKKIYVFLGPPYSGKETQTLPLSRELGIPVFSMGQLIRNARESNPEIKEAFQKYTVKGLHVPIEIKFNLLKKELDNSHKGFILDNFPATKEDLDVFNQYLRENELHINKTFYLNIGEDEMMKRFYNNPSRGRSDDNEETLLVRGKVQGVDREPVLGYFREQGTLVNINGEQPVEAVSIEIRKYI